MNDKYKKAQQKYVQSHKKIKFFENEEGIQQKNSCLKFCQKEKLKKKLMDNISLSVRVGPTFRT